MSAPEIPPFVVVSMDGRHVTIETYRYQLQGYADTVWNVTYARQLAEQGHIHTTAPIAPAEMLNIAQRNGWDPGRLAHVDPAVPGIAAPLVYEGAIVYILIDGMHRNARAILERRQFWARLLTDDASRACHIEGPEELMPWGRK